MSTRQCTGRAVPSASLLSTAEETCRLQRQTKNWVHVSLCVRLRKSPRPLSLSFLKTEMEMFLCRKLSGVKELKSLP